MLGLAGVCKPHKGYLIEHNKQSLYLNVIKFILFLSGLLLDFVQSCLAGRAVPNHLKNKHNEFMHYLTQKA